MSPGNVIDLSMSPDGSGTFSMSPGAVTAA